MNSLTELQNPPDPLDVTFAGKRGAVFWLAFKTGILSILTLGIYRFWMKTRLRRWYWSSIRIGGHPMEYTGDPIEKLLGFLIAVVILAFYIGIVNLLLMFASFSLFEGTTYGYFVSFLGVVPLWFYARYRARRYILARTRWRGVRFALDPGAWGYAWRALVHWAVTIVSAGLLWPRMTFWLEKYKTDRTNFGSLRLTQEGRWPMLYKAGVPFVIALFLAAGFAAWVLWYEPIGVDLTKDPFLQSDAFWGESQDLWRLWFAIPVALAVLYGVIHYAVASRRILNNHKTANGMRLDTNPRPKRVFSIYCVGYLISYLVLVIGFTGLIFLAGYFFGIEQVMTVIAPDQTQNLPPSDLPRSVVTAILVVVYFFVFLMWSVLYQAFVTFPLLRHYAVTLSVLNPDALHSVSQRARDEFAEAEGFAEALDLGAAI